MALWSIGPRQMSGWSGLTRKAIEMNLTPKFSAGTILRLRGGGISSRPIIMGTFGPRMSASNRPTRAPSMAREIARLTAMVVLPTPPLPLETAMVLRKFWPIWSPMRRSLGTLASQLIVTAPMPGTRASAARESLSILPRRGQAGVVSMMVKATSPPSIFRLRIMFSDTRSRCNSGSMTVPNAFSTVSSVRDGVSFFRPNIVFLPSEE